MDMFFILGKNSSTCSTVDISGYQSSVFVKHVLREVTSVNDWLSRDI